jgi:hypothetical protein
MKWLGLVAVLLVVQNAAAEPLTFAHLHSPRLACLGTLQAPVACLELSAGYFLDESTFSKLDAEMKRLQDAETRLKTENMSLKSSAYSWDPGPIVVASTFLVGVALGLYVGGKI